MRPDGLGPAPRTHGRTRPGSGHVACVRPQPPSRLPLREEATAPHPVGDGEPSPNFTLNLKGRSPSGLIGFGSLKLIVWVVKLACLPSQFKKRLLSCWLITSWTPEPGVPRIQSWGSDPGQALLPTGTQRKPSLNILYQEWPPRGS